MRNAFPHVKSCLYYTYWLIKPTNWLIFYCFQANWVMRLHTCVTWTLLSYLALLGYLRALLRYLSLIETFEIYWIIRRLTKFSDYIRWNPDCCKIDQIVTLCFIKTKLQYNIKVCTFSPQIAISCIIQTFMYSHKPIWLYNLRNGEIQSALIVLKIANFQRYFYKIKISETAIAPRRFISTRQRIVALKI